MKRVILLAMLLLAAALPAAAQNQSLPELHTIKKATLSPAYGCRAEEQVNKGYQNTALYLASKQRGPELLFTGACGSEDSFRAALAGDDMSLIADLGEGVNLEDVSAHLAFNLKNLHAATAYTKFVQSVDVKLNHTYVVLLNNSNRRGLFVFTVTGYVQNERVDLKYAVKEYQLLRGVEAQSPGFNWEQKSEAARENH